MSLDISNYQPIVFTPENAFYGYLQELSWANTLGVGNAVWPAANLAIYMPFSVRETVIVDRVGIYNGSAANTGNYDVGIYDAKTLARLVSSGSTAQSGGSSLIQTITITDTTLVPGIYFLAVASDSGSLTTFRFATTVGGLESIGVRTQGTAFTLPDPMVPAATVAAAYMPLCILLSKGT